ncbi:hypothetical protein HK098_005090 [Nowakowskiella sp. JEL0407]|nr:hypothetical protein HK098_005090 [Nowakowskiella sp. JEL0407]
MDLKFEGLFNEIDNLANHSGVDPTLMDFGLDWPSIFPLPSEPFTTDAINAALSDETVSSTALNQNSDFTSRIFMNDYQMNEDNTVTTDAEFTASSNHFNSSQMFETDQLQMILQDLAQTRAQIGLADTPSSEATLYFPMPSEVDFFNAEDQRGLVKKDADISEPLSMQSAGNTEYSMEHLREFVLKYLTDPSSEQTVIIFHPRVCQKSYGKERRFFCPPPKALFVGNWDYDHETPFRPFLSLLREDFTPEPSKPLLLIPKKTIQEPEIEPESPLTRAKPSKKSKSKSTSNASKSAAKAFRQDELRTAVGVEGAVESNIMMRVDKICRTSYVSDEIDAQKFRPIVGSSFKGLYVSDSEKDKNFDLVLTVHRDIGQDAVFKSPELKIISKPSKHRNGNRSVDTCMVSGTLVSMYNRVRSQTISTRYLTVSPDLTKFQTSQSDWSSFVIWAIDDPDLDMNLVGCESPIQSERIKQLGWSISRSSDDRNELIAKFPLQSPTLRRSTSSTGSRTGSEFEVVRGERKMKNICYGDVIVLEHTESGLLSVPLIIRKIGDTSLAVIESDNGSETESEKCREPVSQLQKVCFEIRDQKDHFMTRDDENVLITKSRSIQNPKANTLIAGRLKRRKTAKKSKMSSRTPKKPSRRISSVNLLSDDDYVESSDEDTDDDFSPDSEESDYEYEKAPKRGRKTATPNLKKVDVGERGAWTIVEIKDTEYTFWEPKPNLLPTQHNEIYPKKYTKANHDAVSAKSILLIPNVTSMVPVAPNNLSMTGVNFTPDLVCFFGPIPARNTVAASSNNIIVDLPQITDLDFQHLRNFSLNFAIESEKRAIGVNNEELSHVNMRTIHMPILLVGKDGAIYRTGFYHAFK